MNKYYKNSILCGEIDYYCLLCEETFKDLADVERHIRWESHRKKLKNNTYFPKFKGDFIAKLGTLYYCEVCNTVMPTTLKSSLHIADPKHVQQKQNPDGNSPQSTAIVKRDAGSIKISNIILNEKQWNGIIDSQCILCDMDLDDVDGHMKTSSHVIALIQTKTECTAGDRLYRKIGTDIFFCFTCKQPSAIAFFNDHWTSKEHLDSKNKNSNNAVNNGASSSNFSDEFKKNMRKMFASPAATKPKGEKNPEIADKLQEFQKENIDINFERSKATCKKCNFTPAFTVKAIMEHIKMHKKAENDSPGFQATALSDEENDDDEDDEQWETDSSGSPTEPESDDEKENLNLMGNIDHGQLRAELARFGKPHFIKLARGGSKGYCTLCDSYISAHIKNFKQHVKGAKHRGHIELKKTQNSKTQNTNTQNTKTQNATNTGQSQEYQTKPLKQYLRNIFFVKQMDDFWINRKLCVDKHSFMLLCHQENNGKYDKMKCFLCDDIFPSDKDQAHCMTFEHKNKLFASKVLTSLKREFVREVRPNLFHCGFCNEVCPSWLTMKRHLKSMEHSERREQQKMVADMTDDMYGMSMEDGNTAETDIMWMQLMGNRLF